LSSQNSTHELSTEALTIELKAHGLSPGGTRSDMERRLEDRLDDEHREGLATAGVLVPQGISSPSRASLRRQITLLRQLERQAKLVFIHGRESLPFLLDSSRLKKELKMRRLSDHGERKDLEERLEHALMKEECAKTYMADDGYAYGRVEVDVDEFLEPKTNKELAVSLVEQYGVHRTEIPKKKGGKVALSLLSSVPCTSRLCLVCT